MSALWRLGEASVHDVRARLEPRLAYTTVSTLIRLLEAKGYVGYRRGEGKTHLYYPLVDERTAGASVLSRVLDKIYGGSPVRLLAHLVESRKLSDDELRRMRATLAAARKGGRR